MSLTYKAETDLHNASVSRPTRRSSSRTGHAWKQQQRGDHRTTRPAPSRLSNAHHWCDVNLHRLAVVYLIVQRRVSEHVDKTIARLPFVPRSGNVHTSSTLKPSENQGSATLTVKAPCESPATCSWSTATSSTTARLESRKPSQIQTRHVARHAEIDSSMRMT